MCAICVLCLTSCSKGGEPAPDLSGSPNTSADSTSGDSSVIDSSMSGVFEPAPATVSDFFRIPLKIKCNAVDASTNPSRSITLELYLDGNGNGEGLIGFGETVLNIVASDDKLYILVDPTHPVYITDITPRCYFSTIVASDIGDLVGTGFSFVSEFPAEFRGAQGDLTLYTKYAKSENTYTAKRVSDDVSMTLVDAVNYAIEFNGTNESKQPANTFDQIIGDALTETVQTVYVESEYGIEIDGKVYSIGDTCNLDDYMDELLPSGILNSYDYKEDKRVEFTHVSYVSASGNTTVTLLNNYVQAIKTDTNFDFCGFKPGMSAKDVKSALGYKLSAKEYSSETIFNENILVDYYKNNTYYCHVGNIEIEFRINKTGLYEIYIAQMLEF